MSGIPAGAGSLLGKRLGKYEIVALLALGGTAEIYLARIGGAAGFEKYVVVKCLHDHLADDTEFVKMFLDEARLAAHLDHSNIVQTMELGEHENRYYMVMEFLAGLSLAMIVRRAAERLPNGRIPIPLVLNMVAQSCAGLHYAHGRVMNGKPLNIVHRDISPQNLVVSFEGVVKVVDFGIAKAELRETRTRSGTIKGKFAYMSPEQCVANNVDRRTDVFALGVIAHELLTGRRLFKKGSAYETYQAVLECAVEPPSQLDPEIDAELDEIVMRAVAKDKEQRYATAEAFGDAILGYLHHRGKGSGPGDVSRFFEASFAQEIDEHGARMRELISGREFAAEGVNWGAEDEEGKQIVDIADAMGAKPMGLSEDSGLLADVIGGIDSATGDLGDEDDLPAERTRIEANPLERLNELEAEVAKTRAKQKTPTPQPVVVAPAPAQKPDPATVPTMIGEPDKSARLLRATVDPNARTAMNLTPPPMLTNGAPSGPPAIAPRVEESPSSRASEPTMLGADELDETVAQSPSMLSGLDAGRSGSGLPRQPLPVSELPRVAHGPMDMEPSLLEQLDTVLVPSQSLALEQPPAPARHQDAASQPTSLDLGPPPLDPSAPGSGPRMQPPLDPSAGPQGQPMMPGQPQPGQRPVHLPASYPVMNAQLREQMTSGATVFPSDVASPVGPGYQEGVDWEAAAATDARPMPAWKLAIIFVGTLGLALLITILIAQAVR